jgi:SAM-dependent methyltransferase
VRLNLGCSDGHLRDFINVDICPPADQIADLRGMWPWPDSSVDHIRAYDIIEHMPDKIHTMNEAWRVLRPGGTFDIFVPTTLGEGAFQDPSHVSYWCRGSFLYHTVGVAEYERFKLSLGLRGGFSVISCDDHGQWYGGYVKANGETAMSVHKLKIVLAAVK